MTMQNASSRAAGIRAMGYGSIAAGVLLGVGFLLHPTESADAAVTLASIAANPSRWYGAHLMLFAGLGFMIPAILLLMDRLCLTAPRAARWLGVGTFIGLVCAIAFVTIDAVVFWALARPGLDAATVGKVFDELVKGAGPQVIFAPGLLLNIGIVGMSVALFRSRTIPRWVAVCLAAGMVVQVFFGASYIYMAGAVAGALLGAGLIGLGVDAVRRAPVAGEDRASAVPVPTGVPVSRRSSV
jgi:hypothetical protein